MATMAHPATPYEMALVMIKFGSVLCSIPLAGAARWKSLDAIAGNGNAIEK